MDTRLDPAAGTRQVSRREGREVPHEVEEAYYGWALACLDRWMPCVGAALGQAEDAVVAAVVGKPRVRRQDLGHGERRALDVRWWCYRKRVWLRWVQRHPRARARRRWVGVAVAVVRVSRLL